VIQAVKTILDRLGVKYALIGAMAMAARGHARFTLDCDFLTTDKAVLDPEVWRELPSVDVRKGEFDDPLAGVVRVGDPAEVDVVVGKWKWQHRAIEEAEPLQIAGIIMPVARASDLILMKLDAGGYQSRLDILALLEHGPRERLIAEVDAKLDDLPSTAEKDARAMWREILTAP
jgi:hypothetical protein